MPSANRRESKDETQMPSLKNRLLRLQEEQSKTNRTRYKNIAISFTLIYRCSYVYYTKYLTYITLR
jgi:hypothetical protein